MSGSIDDLRAQHIDQRLKSLDARLARGERQRKWFFVALAAMSVAVAVLLYLEIQSLMSRSQARRYYNDRLHMLVCAIPPGSETNNVRAEFDCGPYRPAKSHTPSSTPTRVSHTNPTRRSTPTPSASVTRTGEAVLLPAPASTTARPQRGIPVHEPGRAALPATRTATRTVAAQPAPTSTPRPAPSRTTGLVPGLLCTVLGCS